MLKLTLIQLTFPTSAVVLSLLLSCSENVDAPSSADTELSNTNQTPDDGTDDDETDNGTPSSTDSGSTQSTPGDFVADNGYVVMEMESANLPDGASWTAGSDLDGFTGSGYYEFTGNGICSGPATSPITFSFTISKAAQYELRLRAAKIRHCVTWKKPEQHTDDTETSTCNHSNGTCDSVSTPSGTDCVDPTTQCLRQDISNDAFVHIDDAEGKYVPFLNQPSKTVGDGIKLFGGSAGAWAWTGDKALDVSGKKWPVLWDLDVGNYTLTIEGRSKLFRIDRIVLFDKATGDVKTALELEETK